MTDAITALKGNGPGRGPTLDDWAEAEGFREEMDEAAIKAVIAHEVGLTMKAQAMTKTALANRMETSRSQVDRLLDPKHEGVTLGTLVKAAKVLGRTLVIQLV